MFVFLCTPKLLKCIYIYIYGNARVGAGGRQRGYQTAGRVNSRIGSSGKQTQGKRLEMSDGAKQDFVMCAWKCAAYMCVCE